MEVLKGIGANATIMCNLVHESILNLVISLLPEWKLLISSIGSHFPQTDWFDYSCLKEHANDTIGYMLFVLEVLAIWISSTLFPCKGYGRSFNRFNDR